MVTAKQKPKHAADREQCLLQLQSDPHDFKARLQLARLYFADGLYEFSLRELVELKRRINRELPSLEKLLEAFGPMADVYLSQSTPSTDAETSADDKVLAEIDLDTDFAEALDEIEVDVDLDDDND